MHHGQTDVRTLTHTQLPRVLMLTYFAVDLQFCYYIDIFEHCHNGSISEKIRIASKQEVSNQQQRSYSISRLCSFVSQPLMFSLHLHKYCTDLYPKLNYHNKSKPKLICVKFVIRLLLFSTFTVMLVYYIFTYLSLFKNEQN